MPLLPSAFPTAFHNKTTEVFLTKVLGVTSSSLTPVFPTTDEINVPTKDITPQGPTARPLHKHRAKGVFCPVGICPPRPAGRSSRSLPPRHRGAAGCAERPWWPGLTSVAAGRGLEQQPPAEEGGDGQGGREAEAGKEAHFWGVLGAQCC